MGEGAWIRISDNRWRRLSRREFLRLAAAAGAGAAAAGLMPLLRPPRMAVAQARRLTFLHWSHFVPGLDTWFDGEYTKEWRKAHEVEVTVDRVPCAQFPPRAAAGVAAGRAHRPFAFIT